jgi:hypothetical protein
MTEAYQRVFAAFIFSVFFIVFNGGLRGIGGRFVRSCDGRKGGFRGLDVDVGNDGRGVFDEEFCDFSKPVVAGPDERGVAIVVSGTDVGTVVDEEFCEIGQFPFASPDEGSNVVFISGVNVGAVVDGILDGG